MMLPKEIKEARFSRAFKGYNDREVDEFLNRVLEDYGQLYRDNAELEHKIEILADKIREYKNAEQNLEDAKKKVLRMAQERVSEARDEAARIEREAKEKAERILIDAKREAERERRNYERLQLEVTRFKNKTINLFKTEIDQLNNLPSLQVTPQEMMRIQTESMNDENEIFKKEAPQPLKSIIEEAPDTAPDQDIFGNSINFDEPTQYEKEREDKKSSHTFTLNLKAKEEPETPIEEPKVSVQQEETAVPVADESLEEEPLTMNIKAAEEIIEEQINTEEHVSEVTEEKIEEETENYGFIRVENHEIENIIHQNQQEKTKPLPPAEEDDVRPIQAETGNFEIIDTSDSIKLEKKQKEEHPKFGQLRFGDDYDLETDDFSGGIFSRRRKKKD